MTKIKLLAIAVGAVIGTGASFYGLSVIGPRITAAYWRQQLAAAPDDGVEIVIRRIAELDRAGIAVLAAALGSERECVAQAAKQELFAQLEQWRRLSVGENASRLTELARVRWPSRSIILIPRDNETPRTWRCEFWIGR